MNIEYVLVDKKDKDDKSLHLTSKAFKESLKKCFKNVLDSQFEIEFNKKTYTINYNKVRCKASDTDKNDLVYNLQISFEHKTRTHESKILEFVHNSLYTCSELKSSFYFIVAYDGISSYYCNKAYPKFHEFERQLRHFIFKLLTKSFGTLWLDKTIDSNLKDELKKRININNKKIREEKLIEIALYEMSAYQLEEYLFNETKDLDYDIYSVPTEKLNELSKDELLELIEKGKAKTLWDRYFDKEIHIDALQEKLIKIRNYRNDISHSKHFHSTEYNDFLAIISELTENVVVGIDKIAITESKSLFAQEALCGFADALVSFGAFAAKIGKAVAPIISSMSNFGATLYDVYQQNNSFNQISSVVDTAQKILSTIPTIPEPILPSPVLNIDLENSLMKHTALEEALNVRDTFFSGVGSKLDYSLHVNNKIIESIEKFKKISELCQPKFPALELIKRQQQMLDAIMPLQVSNFSSNWVIDNEIDEEQENTDSQGEKPDVEEEQTND